MEHFEIGDQSHPEDVGGIQSFPVLERDESGKLTPESLAAIAIQGMLPGKVADEAERLEKEYQAYKETSPSPANLKVLGILVCRVFKSIYLELAQSFLAWHYGEVSILRKQVAVLALGYQESQNKLGQMEVQRGFYDQYLLMQEGNTKFRAFLLENFPEEMKVADATNQPLIQFAQGLMLQLKSKVQ